MTKTNARRKTAREYDPREVPCYGIPEAAHYLRVAETTLRAWCVGQNYESDGKQKRYRSLIRIADPQNNTLSFFNLVEAHILKAMRRDHRISMQKIRRGLTWIGQEFPSPRPLIDHGFATDGVDLYCEHYDRLYHLTYEPQLAIREVLNLYLTRIERDGAGLPIKLFPFTHRDENGDPGVVEVDATVSFGRPVLRGTGVVTRTVADRYKAGESVAQLARDYGRKESEIEEALRCEIPLQAA